MISVRQQNFLLRKEKILAMAETLLLDNNQDITLSELATELDIAKGTIYKHFNSKNQLYIVYKRIASMQEKSSVPVWIRQFIQLTNKKRA